MSIIIRNAQPTDTNTIAQFQQEMALETENLTLDISVLQEGVAAVFEDSNKGKYFIAEIDNKVAGSLLITYEWSDWRNSTVIWIQSVFVKPEFRKKGIFKSLYNHIHKMWVDNKQKYGGIRLYVDKTNTRAMNVYTKIGMNGEHYQVFETM